MFRTMKKRKSNLAVTLVHFFLQSLQFMFFGSHSSLCYIYICCSHSSLWILAVTLVYVFLQSLQFMVFCNQSSLCYIYMLQSPQFMVFWQSLQFMLCCSQSTFSGFQSLNNHCYITFFFKKHALIYVYIYIKMYVFICKMQATPSRGGSPIHPLGYRYIYTYIKHKSCAQKHTHVFFCYPHICVYICTYIYIYISMLFRILPSSFRSRKQLSKWLLSYIYIYNYIYIYTMLLTSQHSIYSFLKFLLF